MSYVVVNIAEQEEEEERAESLRVARELQKRFVEGMCLCHPGSVTRASVTTAAFLER